MLGFFDPLMKFLKLEKIETDNLIFRLHYKVTFPVFILFSAMLTGNQYFGNPIDCLTQAGVSQSLMNTYCWTHGTYTVKRFEHVTRRPPTQEEQEHLDFFFHNGEIHPGVATSNKDVNQRQYYVFYQWVCFVIFIQAIFFFAPRFIWKTFVENGKMKFLTADTRDLTTESSEIDNRVGKLLVRFNKLKGKNHKYANAFILLEWVNFANVLFQFMLTNLFLHGRFWNYGWRLIDYYLYYEVAWDPMDEIFPKMTKCQFNKHGPGGGIENRDSLCLLPLNIVNEKIYLLMWVWMILLGIASGAAVIYRTLCMCFPEVRTFMLWRTMNKWSDVSKVCSKRPYGDWFLLRQMAKNVEAETFDHFLTALGKDEDFKAQANYKTLPMKMLGRGFIKNPASDEKNAGFEMNPPGYNNYSLELDNELAASKMNNNNNNSINSKENEAERISE